MGKPFLTRKRRAICAPLGLLLASCHSSSHSPGSPVKKWEFVTGQLHEASRGSFYEEQIPTIGADGTIYAGGSHGLYALHPDGTEAWFYNSFYQSPYYPIHFVVIDDHGDIWFDVTSTLPNSGNVVRVNPSGEETSAVGLTSRITQIAESPDGAMVANGRFIDIEGKVATLRPWILGGYFYSFGADGTPYSAGSGVTAYEADHNMKWTTNTSSSGEPVIGSDGTIYVGGWGALSAINADGTGKWSYAVPRKLALSPAVASDGTVYFGSDDGNLYALNPEGRLKWKYSDGAAVHTTPAITKNGNIYFGSGNNLECVDANGKLKWKFVTGGQVFSPTIGDDGTIYFQNGEGKVVALQDSEANGGLSGQWPKRGGGVRNTSRAPH